MILGFKTKFSNGYPTYFVQKILKSKNPYSVELKDFKAKIHTIRNDVKKRWKAGNVINFFTGVRTKQMKRFMQDEVCQLVQEIIIIWIEEDLVDLFIDDKYINNLEELAINDGFDNINDFLSYFRKEAIPQKSYPIYGNSLPVYQGRLIHWTEHKY